MLESVGLALFNKGLAFRAQNKFERAIAPFNNVFSRFKDSDELKLAELAARSLFYEGVTLAESGKRERALIVFDDLVAQFGKFDQSQIKDHVRLSYLNKGKLLSTLKRPQEARKAYREATRGADADNYISQAAAVALSVPQEEGKEDIVSLLNEVLAAFPEEKRTELLKAVQERSTAAEEFLDAESQFRSGSDSRSLFLDLREWNSYTPALPGQHEVDRGGGYFIRYRSQGIVIDPGYDFIRNFQAAGGRICDINHIVVTHAHNDHTQDFESLLTLLHQFNKQHKWQRIKKRVHLYLSQGAERKFSGYLGLRGIPYIGNIEILNPGKKQDSQKVRMHDLRGAKLTILRAYHDDVITEDSSVGLGFEFKFGRLTRRVVFTGDTGLFPIMRDEKGAVVKSEREDEPQLDIDEGCKNALYNQYPNRFKGPDLLVPHIGSIKDYEFKKMEQKAFAERPEENAPFFYPNHLGVRGLALLLSELRPKAAVISEFGAELKDVRFELARCIAQYLEKRGLTGEKKVVVIPGDLTVVYDIGEGKFLCHDDRLYHKPNDVVFQEVKDQEKSPFCIEEPAKSMRTFIFSKKTLSPRGQNQGRRFLQSLGGIRSTILPIER